MDEADKAPTHVTVLLKALAESGGQLLLPDGRRIIMHANGDASVRLGKDVIVAHPGFRMVILANRPGYPFMGNDFFKASGGAFATHAIDNADVQSEMQMLRKYAVPANASGREVPAGVLKRLALAFADLRDLEQAGTLTHSYSTRELVAATVHLAAFPSDGVPSALKGTFDFDQLRVPDAERNIIANVVHCKQEHTRVDVQSLFCCSATFSHAKTTIRCFSGMESRYLAVTALQNRFVSTWGV